MELWRRTPGFYANLIHMLFYLPAVTLYNVIPDFMHCVDLGVSHHALGNAIFEMVCLPHFFPTCRTNDERKDALWDRITRQYAARGTPNQLSNLEHSFFCNTDAPHQHFPVLTTRIKAAETRNLSFITFECT